MHVNTSTYKDTQSGKRLASTMAVSDLFEILFSVGFVLFDTLLRVLCIFASKRKTYVMSSSYKKYLKSTPICVKCVHHLKKCQSVCLSVFYVFLLCLHVSLSSTSVWLYLVAFQDFSLYVRVSAFLFAYVSIWLYVLYVRMSTSFFVAVTTDDHTHRHRHVLTKHKCTWFALWDFLKLLISFVYADTDTDTRITAPTRPSSAMARTGVYENARARLHASREYACSRMCTDECTCIFPERNFAYEQVQAFLG